jgi:hypothetical protein
MESGRATLRQATGAVAGVVDRGIRGASKKVGFTRSRPYHKDDNGHVEEKNWTRVRQLLGYERFEDRAVVEPLNELYREVWEPLHNFFLPCAKLEAKSRHGAKVQRKHDKPKTPCDRLLESEHVSVEAKERLRARRAELDPFELHDRLEEGLRRVLPLARTSSRPTASLRCGPNEGKKE